MKALSRLGFDLKGNFAEMTYKDIDGKKSFTWSTITKDKQKIEIPIKSKDKKFTFYKNLSNKKIVENALGRYLFKKDIPHIRLKYHPNQDLSKVVHKLDGAIIGGYQKPNFDCIRFDIDEHDNDYDKALKKVTYLLDFFKPYLPMLLCESEKGGYHVYYKLDRFITKNTIKTFLAKYNKEHEGFEIEYPAMIRIPFNPHYNIINIYDKYELENFKNSEHVFKLYHPNDIANHILNWQEKVPVSIIYEYIKEPKKEKEKINPINPYLRQSRKTSTSESLQDKLNSIVISLGHRYYNMFSIISYCKKLNYSTDQIVNHIRSVNTGSKDLNKWNDNKLKQEVESILDWMKSNENNETEFTEIKTTEFKSNTSLVPSYIQSYLRSYQFISEVIKELRIKPLRNGIRTKWQIAYYKTIPILAIEIVGKMIYDETSKRKIKSELKIGNEKKEKLLIGSQFSEKYLLMLKEYYNLKGINIKRLFNGIVKTNLFNQYYSNKRGWSYNYLKVCKQYIINSELYNNVINNIKYFIKKFKLILDYKKNNRNYIHQVFETMFSDRIDLQFDTGYQKNCKKS